MQPTIGRIVLYRLTERDVDFIEKGRVALPDFKWGSDLAAGEYVPMMVTRVAGGRINGRAMLDGTDTLWCKGVEQAETTPGLDMPNGTWCWPPRA